MTTTTQDLENKAGALWDSLPIRARLALCESLDIEGKQASATWGKVWDHTKPRLVAALLEDDDAKPADTDPRDRSEHAGWSDGKPVYRASMAGRCLKELFLWRIGTGKLLPKRDESHDTTDKGMLAAKEGVRHEQWVVEDLMEQGYEIAWAGEDQRELERRYKRYIVRSHPDGMIRGKELGEEWRVLECKAMNEDRFALFESMGFDAFHGYAYQLSLEMDLSGAPAFFVTKNRNTGQIIKHLINVPPVEPKKIYARFSKIENIIEAAEVGDAPSAPECGPDAEWYFCPFFSLGHCDILAGKDAEEVTEVDDEEFVGILVKYKEAKAMIKKGKEIVDALRLAITDRMISPRLRVGEYFASYSQRKRVGFNIPGAKQRLQELGVDPHNYDKETAYMELRVTGGPKEEAKDEEDDE